MTSKLTIKRVYHEKGAREEVLIPTSLPKKGKDDYYNFFLSGPCWHGENCTIKFHVIGSLSLVRTKYGFYETHSDIYKLFNESKGYGIELYKRAIQYALKNKLEVRSSSYRTFKASRLWQSKRLNSVFKIKKCKKRFKVIT